MKKLQDYIIEKEQFNQSDEDYFVTMLTWQCDDGGDLKIEDDQFIVNVKKENKNDVLNLCKRQDYEVISAKAEGKGWSKIIIKRDKSKQTKKYNLN